MAEVVRVVGTANLSASTSSSSANLTGNGNVIRCVNAGSVPVFYEFGQSNVQAAVASSRIVLPGTVELFTISPGDTHYAVITETGTARCGASRCYGDV